MAEQQQQPIHTDLYGTWTVQLPLAHGDQGKPGPGMKNGSKFRITFDVEKKKHILVKLNDLRWNTSSDPIELIENRPDGKFVSFRSTTPVDVLEPNEQVHGKGVLTLMSKDGVNLIVQIEDPQGQTGHTGTGSAGRP